jgi:hypothetical protein
MDMNEPQRITDAQLDLFLNSLDCSGLERLKNRIISPEARRFMGIPGYLVDDLLEALRRDLRSEQRKIHDDPEYRLYHQVNVGRITSILELINPKHTTCRDMQVLS